MLRFHVSNMSCGGCAKGVTRAVQGLDGNAKIDIDLPSREINVRGAVDAPGVVAALKRAGYEARTLGA
ncbi:MAG: heavy-metal-associated domain-containing protein [Methylobacterium sp.]|jgi:copper chaperone|uniref:heavy-metal-associated domain-containing protein n=1 Tax=Methylobacterium sp. TaxID=409 RepID=UPI0025860D07|nr:heavy-metal-associated domain-containing protein [Methylobacterium sp.]MBY0295459.1 heavy-metal-associated domain-containing protein [Methylobacterium sp.]